MKKKLISSLLAISMIITAVQPQITFAEDDIEITSEQESEDVMETEVTEENLSDGENITEENSDEEITEETEAEDQSIEDSIVEEQILDESETADPLQTYAEDNNEETQSDFLYTVLEDGTAEITGYQGKTDGDLIIPDSIDGYTVTSIGESAFSGCNFNGSLTIANSVKNIGTFAFSNCNFTGDIILPIEVINVGVAAFYNCHVNDIFGNFILQGDIETVSKEIFDESSERRGKYVIKAENEIGIGQSQNAYIIVSGMRLDKKFVKEWSTSNKNIVDVGTEGVVTAYAEGNAVIYAELFNGVICQLDITVTKTQHDLIEKDHVLYTTPDIGYLNDLLVGDKIYIGRGVVNGQYGVNSSIESVNAVSGGDAVKIEQNMGWQVECIKTGNVKLQINYKNSSIAPDEVMLCINEKKIEAVLLQKTLKLGKVITGVQLKNFPYGGEPMVYVDDSDAQNFMIHGDKISWGGELEVFEREPLARRIMFHDDDPKAWATLRANFARVATYPGKINLLVYKSTDNFDNNEDPLMTIPTTIEEPIISHNIKYNYKINDAQDVEIYLDNTEFVDEEIDKLEWPDYWLYYVPKLEIISGKDCVEFIGESKLTTLSLKQQIRFIKAGTVKFKISYEPSGINASVNKVYRPEKIVTVQVNPQTVTATFNSAGGSNISSQTVAVGSRIVEPKDPVRSGYTFLGWYVDGQKYDFTKGVEKDITLVAKWKKQITNVTGISIDKKAIKIKKEQMEQLKVTVIPKNATNKAVKWETSNARVATVKNGKVTAKNFGKAIVTATALDGSGKKVSCNVTVGYTIAYKLNGGKNTKDNPAVYYNEVVKLKNPIRKGYNFVGWFADKKMKKRVKQIMKKDKKNLNLYAKWEKIKVGSGKLTSATRKNASSMVIKYLSVPKAKGYEITYATDKKFKKNCKVVTTKAKSITLKKLQSKKTYYVKVRAYKLDSAGNKIYGKYSAVKTVKKYKKQVTDNDL